MEGPIAVYTEDPHDGTLTLRATLPEAHVAGAVPQCGDTLCAHWDPAEPQMLEVRRRYVVPEPATAGAPPPGTFALVVAPRPATRGERPLLRDRAAPEALTAVRLHRAMAATLPALLECADAPRQGVRVRTPPLYPDGGVVDVFVVARRARYTVTDFGEALGWLRMRPASGRRRAVGEVCASLGVALVRGQLVLRLEGAPTAHAVLRLAQAAGARVRVGHDAAQRPEREVRALVSRAPLHPAAPAAFRTEPAWCRTPPALRHRHELESMRRTRYSPPSPPDPPPARKRAFGLIPTACSAPGPVRSSFAASRRVRSRLTSKSPPRAEPNRQPIRASRAVSDSPSPTFGVPVKPPPNTAMPYPGSPSSRRDAPTSSFAARAPASGSSHRRCEPPGATPHDGMSDAVRLLPEPPGTTRRAPPTRPGRRSRPRHASQGRTPATPCPDPATSPCAVSRISPWNPPRELTALFRRRIGRDGGAIREAVAVESNDG